MLTIHMLNLKKVAALIQNNFINFLWVQQPKKKNIYLKDYYIEKVVNIIHWLAVQSSMQVERALIEKFSKRLYQLMLIKLPIKNLKT